VYSHGGSREDQTEDAAKRRRRQFGEGLVGLTSPCELEGLQRIHKPHQDEEGGDP